MDELNSANTEGQTQGHGLSRRTLVRGAAYAVPAVTLLSATPAMAASGGNVGEFILQSIQRDGNNNTELHIDCSVQPVNNNLVMNPASVVITFTFTNPLPGGSVVMLGGAEGTLWTMTQTTSAITVTLNTTLGPTSDHSLTFYLIGDNTKPFSAANTVTAVVTVTSDITLTQNASGTSW